jgi:hypothetical protein
MRWFHFLSNYACAGAPTGQTPSQAPHSIQVSFVGEVITKFQQTLSAKLITI